MSDRHVDLGRPRMPGPASVVRHAPAAGALRARAEEWVDRFLGSDPGLNRLRLALQAVVTIGAAMAAEWLFVRATGALQLSVPAGAPPAVAAELHALNHGLLVVAIMLGAVTGMIASFAGSMFGTVREQVIGFALLPVPMIAGLSLGLALANHRVLALASLVAILALGAYCRRFGPRGFFGGMVAFMGDFFGFFLHGEVSIGDVGWLAAEIALGVLVAALAQFTLFYPSRRAALRRMLRSYTARSRGVSRLALELFDDEPTDRPRTARRLRRRLVRLNESALMIDAQLTDPAAVPTGWSPELLHQCVFDMELALTNMARFSERLAALALPDQTRRVVRQALWAVAARDMDLAEQSGRRLLAQIEAAGGLPLSAPTTAFPRLSSDSAAGDGAPRGGDSDGADVIVLHRFATSVRGLVAAARVWRGYEPSEVTQQGTHSTPAQSPIGFEPPDFAPVDGTHREVTASAAGPSAAGPSAAGPSAAGPSAAGPREGARSEGGPAESTESAVFEPSVLLVGGWLPGSAMVSGDASREPVAKRGPLRRLRIEPNERIAVQMAVATTAAIVIGDALSGRRFYWALIAAFVTFMGAHNAGEQLRKGFFRVAGTIVGVLLGAVIAHLVGDRTKIAIVVILVALFVGLYLMRISYTFMVIGITIMVSQLYVQLDEFSDSLLVLRLEETALGAAAAALTVLCVLPLRPGLITRIAARDYLRSVAELTDAAVGRLIDPDRSPIPLRAAARRLDAAYQALIASVAPLRIPLLGNANLRGQVLRSATAARYYARNLVVDTDYGDRLDPRRATWLRAANERFTASLQQLIEASEHNDATRRSYVRSAALFDLVATAELVAAPLPAAAGAEAAELPGQAAEQPGAGPPLLALRDLELIDGAVAALAEAVGMRTEALDTGAVTEFGAAVPAQPASGLAATS